MDEQFKKELEKTNKFVDKEVRRAVKQGNISENFNKHTLRGFHYQVHPSCESKIITCVTGSLFNAIIDLRKESETYLNWLSLEISAKNKESIYIPAGCTNAFLTMSENTIVHYYMGDSFNADSYRGIRYNDPMFSVEWPCKPKIISEKDLKIISPASSENICLFIKHLPFDTKDTCLYKALLL